MDYTTVLGVDDNHVQQFRLVWPNWIDKKPSLLQHPLVVFYNLEKTDPNDLFSIVNHPYVVFIDWPPPALGIEYAEDPSAGRFGGAQRYKMLAGFIHVAAAYVNTDYWLKIDLDTIATGIDDWIDDAWFENRPAIIAPSWGYTKPPDQMLKLDAWAKYAEPYGKWLRESSPLRLAPEPGANKVKHRRIISWCGFFERNFTEACSRIAETTCGKGKLPVPSQDGFMWYAARRMGRVIQCADMRSRGWTHCRDTNAISRKLIEIYNG